MIATRMRDTAFKRVLRKVPLGVEVKVEGPSGSFVLHRKAEKPAVLLAGGIGITPFLSIIRQAAHEKAPRRIYLFYSNRRPEDAAFLDALTQTAAQNPNFHLIATMTEMTKSHPEWKGETGFINKDMLSKYLSSLQGPIYYLAGPPAMVAAIRRMVTEAEVDEDDIRTEELLSRRKRQALPEHWTRVGLRLITSSSDIMVRVTRALESPIQSWFGCAGNTP